MSDEQPSSYDRVRRMLANRAEAKGVTVRLGVATGHAGAVSPVTSASLLASARRHAARGMRARAVPEHDDACLQLGTMLEHLAKAYLADLHPTLLLESRYDFSALLRLAGQGQRVSPGHVLKTVGMWDALLRIGIIQANGNMQAANAFAKRFDVVLRARNGVAHVGDDGGLGDEVAQLAVQGADEVLTMMDSSLEDLFGDYTAAAKALQNEHVTKVQQLVTLLIASAKRTFSERDADLSTQQRAADLAALDRLTTVSLDEERDRVATPCPACKHTGILSGSATLEWELGEELEDEEGVHWTTMINARGVLISDAFRCPVCGLRLKGAEQLAEGRLDHRVDLGPVDVDPLDPPAGWFTEEDGWGGEGEAEL